MLDYICPEEEQLFSQYTSNPGVAEIGYFGLGRRCIAIGMSGQALYESVEAQRAICWWHKAKWSSFQF